jgi:hypothetical protein
MAHGQTKHLLDLGKSTKRRNKANERAFPAPSYTNGTLEVKPIRMSGQYFFYRSLPNFLQKMGIFLPLCRTQVYSSTKTAISAETQGFPQVESKPLF